MSDDQLLPGEDLAAWGARTGRYPVARAAYWRQRLEIERRQIQASANPQAASQTEAVIRSLAPVLAVQQDPAPGQVWAKDDTGRTVLASSLAPSTYATSATPRLVELERAMFGPSQAERWAEQDAAGEAALIEQEEAEQRRAAENTLTEDELRALGFRD